MELFINEYIQLEEENGSVFLTVLKEGSSMSDLNELLKDLPRISITKFLPLKEALEEVHTEKTHIGEMKPLVHLMVSKDKMIAKIRLNSTQAELEENREKLISTILETLHNGGVKEGINVSVLHDELKVMKDITIAEGTEPQNGKDAEIIYFKLSDRKPTIREDGKADYYDMNFIDEVKKGTWLGEKTPPTEGTPGKTVTGEVLHPRNGKNKNFIYDRKTVGLFEEDGKSILRALVDGVVSFHGGKIAVGDHLIIEGDVGVETGNIEFDGSVTVKGIINTGYSVTATKDISVLGEMGVSGIKSITSKGGDIFIKGGVFGKGNSIIKAAKNIFVKHANECFLEAGEDINIGYYSIGSVLKGKNIITDMKQGKIIGGSIEAKGKVVTAILGNKMERKTIIQVEGFDRQELERDLEDILLNYKEKIINLETLKRKLDVFESFIHQLNPAQSSQYEEIKEEFEKELLELTSIDENRKSIMSLLETKGEGQVSIHEAAYPETLLQIKNLHRRLSSTVKGTFYAERNYLHFE
ncbi:DUF342 domain-containing protein [Cytobacillus sp. FJAT-54145]|uniref:DUF342 domain-containing protein n=1 Tax=Cytobacillus spartinae TaxID=3299023 RepID=A0ABW6KI45_9BACI